MPRNCLSFVVPIIFLVSFTKFKKKKKKKKEEGKKVNILQILTCLEKIRVNKSVTLLWDAMTPF